MEKTGKNEPCHCGSGKSYKDCHEQKEEQNGSKKTKLITRALVAIVILIIIITTLLNIQPSGSQPPGEAPEGKVWSPEHQHWHDAK